MRLFYRFLLWWLYFDQAILRNQLDSDLDNPYRALLTDQLEYDQQLIDSIELKLNLLETLA